MSLPIYNFTDVVPAWDKLKSTPTYQQLTPEERLHFGRNFMAKHVEKLPEWQQADPNRNPQLAQQKQALANYVLRDEEQVRRGFKEIGAVAPAPPPERSFFPSQGIGSLADVAPGAVSGFGHSLTGTMAYGIGGAAGVLPDDLILREAPDTWVGRIVEATVGGGVSIAELLVAAAPTFGTGVAAKLTAQTAMRKKLVDDVRTRVLSEATANGVTGTAATRLAERAIVLANKEIDKGITGKYAKENIIAEYGNKAVQKNFGHQAAIGGGLGFVQGTVPPIAQALQRDGQLTEENTPDILKAGAGGALFGASLPVAIAGRSITGLMPGLTSRPALQAGVNVAGLDMIAMTGPAALGEKAGITPPLTAADYFANLAAGGILEGRQIKSDNAMAGPKVIDQVAIHKKQLADIEKAIGKVNQKPDAANYATSLTTLTKQKAQIELDLQAAEKLAVDQPLVAAGLGPDGMPVRPVEDQINILNKQIADLDKRIAKVNKKPDAPNHALNLKIFEDQKQPLVDQLTELKTSKRLKELTPALEALTEERRKLAEQIKTYDTITQTDPRPSKAELAEQMGKLSTQISEMQKELAGLQGTTVPSKPAPVVPPVDPAATVPAVDADPTTPAAPVIQPDPIQQPIPFDDPTATAPIPGDVPATVPPATPDPAMADYTSVGNEFVADLLADIKDRPLGEQLQILERGLKNHLEENLSPVDQAIADAHIQAYSRAITQLQDQIASAQPESAVPDSGTPIPFPDQLEPYRQDRDSLIQPEVFLTPNQALKKIFDSLPEEELGPFMEFVKTDDEYNQHNNGLKAHEAIPAAEREPNWQNQLNARRTPLVNRIAGDGPTSLINQWQNMTPEYRQAWQRYHDSGGKEAGFGDLPQGVEGTPLAGVFAEQNARREYPRGTKRDRGFGNRDGEDKGADRRIANPEPESAPVAPVAPVVKPTAPKPAAADKKAPSPAPAPNPPVTATPERFTGERSTKLTDENAQPLLSAAVQHAEKLIPTARTVDDFKDVNKVLHQLSSIAKRSKGETIDRKKTYPKLADGDKLLPLATAAIKKIREQAHAQFLKLSKDEAEAVIKAEVHPAQFALNFHKKDEMLKGSDGKATATTLEAAKAVFARALRNQHTPPVSIARPEPQKPAAPRGRKPPAEKPDPTKGKGAGKGKKAKTAVEAFTHAQTMVPALKSRNLPEAPKLPEFTPDPKETANANHNSESLTLAAASQILDNYFNYAQQVLNSAFKGKEKLSKEQQTALQEFKTQWEAEVKPIVAKLAEELEARKADWEARKPEDEASAQVRSDLESFATSVKDGSINWIGLTIKVEGKQVTTRVGSVDVPGMKMSVSAGSKLIIQQLNNFEKQLDQGYDQESFSKKLLAVQGENKELGVDALFAQLKAGDKSYTKHQFVYDLARLIQDADKSKTFIVKVGAGKDGTGYLLPGLGKGEGKRIEAISLTTKKEPTSKRGKGASEGSYELRDMTETVEQAHQKLKDLEVFTEDKNGKNVNQTVKLNRLATAELDKLDELGIDVSEATDALEEFNVRSWADYKEDNSGDGSTMAELGEGFREEKQSLWEEFLDAFESIDATEVKVKVEKTPDPAPVPAEPVKGDKLQETLNTAYDNLLAEDITSMSTKGEFSEAAVAADFELAALDKAGLDVTRLTELLEEYSAVSPTDSLNKVDAWKDFLKELKATEAPALSQSKEAKPILTQSTEPAPKKGGKVSSSKTPSEQPTLPIKSRQYATPSVSLQRSKMFPNLSVSESLPAVGKTFANSAVRRLKLSGEKINIFNVGDLPTTNEWYRTFTDPEGEHRFSDGVVREASDGSFDIFVHPDTFDNTAKLLETLAHEIGHVADFVYLESLKGKQRNALDAAWHDWVVKFHDKPADEYISDFYTPDRAAQTRDNLSKLDLKALTMQEASKNMGYDYLFAYDEWKAENTSKWLLTKERPAGILSGIFYDLAQTFKHVYSLLTGKKFDNIDPTMKRILDKRSRQPDPSRTGAGKPLTVSVASRTKRSESVHPNQSAEAQARSIDAAEAVIKSIKKEQDANITRSAQIKQRLEELALIDKTAERDKEIADLSKEDAKLKTKIDEQDRLVEWAESQKKNFDQLMEARQGASRLKSNLRGIHVDLWNIMGEWLTRIGLGKPVEGLKKITDKITYYTGKSLLKHEDVHPVTVMLENLTNRYLGEDLATLRTTLDMGNGPHEQLKLIMERANRTDEIRKAVIAHSQNSLTHAQADALFANDQQAYHDFSVALDRISEWKRQYGTLVNSAQNHVVADKVNTLKRLFYNNVGQDDRFLGAVTNIQKAGRGIFDKLDRLVYQMETVGTLAEQLKIPDLLRGRPEVTTTGNKQLDTLANLFKDELTVVYDKLKTQPAFVLRDGDGKVIMDPNFNNVLEHFYSRAAKDEATMKLVQQIEASHSSFKEKGYEITVPDNLVSRFTSDWKVINRVTLDDGTFHSADISNGQETINVTPSQFRDYIRDDKSLAWSVKANGDGTSTLKRQLSKLELDELKRSRHDTIALMVVGREAAFKLQSGEIYQLVADFYAKPSADPSTGHTVKLTSAQFGELQNKYVTKDMQRYLNAFDQGNFNEALKMMHGVVNFYKGTHTVYNPGTQVTNALANTVLMTLNGVPPWRLVEAAKIMVKLARAGESLSDYEPAAIHLGLINFMQTHGGTTSMTSRKWKNFTAMWEKNATAIKNKDGLTAIATSWEMIKQAPRDMYERADMVFRLAHYNHMKDKLKKANGLDSLSEAELKAHPDWALIQETAAIEARQAYVDYMDQNSVVATFNKQFPLLPFYGFLNGIVPQVFRLIKEKPVPTMLMLAALGLAGNVLNTEDAETEAQREMLSDLEQGRVYIGKLKLGGIEKILPHRVTFFPKELFGFKTPEAFLHDKFGYRKGVNISKITPVENLLHFKDYTAFPVPANLLPYGPLTFPFNIWYNSKYGAGSVPISGKKDSSLDKTIKSAAWTADNMLPPWFSKLGNMEHGTTLIWVRSDLVKAKPERYGTYDDFARTFLGIRVTSARN